MTKQRSSSSVVMIVTGLSIIVVAIISMIWPDLQLQQPDLNWETVVVPAAIHYAEAKQQAGSKAINPRTPLQGIVVVITGATSGIGLGLTKRLASLGATIIAVGRNREKLQHVQQSVTGGTIETVVADFRDLQSVAVAAEQIVTHYPRIDVLVNNAGLHQRLEGLVPPYAVSQQGYEVAFGVNYLAHFLWTEKLLPVLLKSGGRIVQVSSRFHYAVDGSDLATHHGTTPPLASQNGGSPGFYLFRTQRQYANSKLSQILHARALNARYPATTTTTPTQLLAVSACPSWVGTDIGGPKGSMMHSLLQFFTFPSTGFGLSSILHAILDTDTTTSRSTANVDIDDDDDDDKTAPPKTTDPRHQRDFYVNTAVSMPQSAESRSSGGSSSAGSSTALDYWTYQRFPVRDVVFAAFGHIYIMFGQRYIPTREVAPSSTASYNPQLQHELYEWSVQAVAAWL